jgi:putative transposase
VTDLRHFDNLGSARFVTFSCHNRYRLLRDTEVIRTFLSELKRFRERGINLLGYVVMPEHVHLVVLPHEDIKLGVEIGRLKSLSARRILPILEEHHDLALANLTVTRNNETRRVFWERRCYDHNCRTPETTMEKIAYCHKNPVSRGLVRTPHDWPWSSSRWYDRLEDVELEIDGVEM